MVQAWLLEEGGAPKLLSLREETPELALPDKVELLPPRADCGLVGEAGIGCRGDWGERDVTADHYSSNTLPRYALAKQANV